MHGVVVEVAPELRGTVQGLVLTVCPDGEACQRARSIVDLPGKELHVVVVDVEIPAGKVRVCGSYLRDGRRVDIGDVEALATTSYPNGRACGADGTQADVRLTADGLQPV